MRKRERLGSVRTCLVIGACMTVATAGLATAGELDPSGWKFSGTNAAEMKKAVDNDLATCWESGGPQKPGTAITIDLGHSVTVYRVYLTPGRELSKFPRSLNVYVGETPETLRLVAKEASRTVPDDKPGELTALRKESLFCFPPEKGRFVKLEIGENGSGMPWAIAEMDIHAATKEVTGESRTAVVVDSEFLTDKDGKPAPANPLKLAAEELRYYLMELKDSPADIVTPTDAESRKGLRFRLVTPPEEKVPSPEPDPVNLDDVSVVKEGSDILISGPTKRSILFGAYEFLNSQGVLWLFPGAHGDSVPQAKDLDFSQLPIKYRPPFSTRGLIAPGIVGMTEEQFDRFQVRHRFTVGHRIPLGVVPRMNCGFGWAHTMGGIFDIKWGEEKPQIQIDHPDWWLGPYRKGWTKVPCVANPEVTEFILRS